MVMSNHDHVRPPSSRPPFIPHALDNSALRCLRLLCVLASALALCASLTGPLKAQVLSETNVVRFTLTGLLESTANDDGTTTVYPRLGQVKITTATLLAYLAEDEFVQGKYDRSSFPPGSQIVVNAAGGDHYQVVDRRFRVLVDVSDILWGIAGTNTLYSGKENDATGLGSPTLIGTAIQTIGFDDTSIPDGVGLRFYVQGLAAGGVTVTPFRPRIGLYHVVEAGTISRCSGEGAYGGTDLIVTGGIVSSGKGVVQMGGPQKDSLSPDRVPVPTTHDSTPRLWSTLATLFGETANP